ncbi:MAG: DUF4911 domain-containing protein [Deltaproteobacteria bacterium]|nr:DUF4911 domain-containing protein [Deltaproteobacteria bacterium]MBW2136103.1 DUF4911 domain-containing protein [Deltaproteobacteria bacterium]
METTKRHLKVERRDINYLRVTLESYDGMVVVRTVDPREAVIELQISPGCESLVFELLRDLTENELMDIRPMA